jgi:type II secretory pathway pseudopilin PulG
MNKYSKGFTVIEISLIISILAVASVLFFTQKNNISTTARDDKRKISINAMYYSLEEVFYKTNNFYPPTIDEKILPAVDPTLFTDPSGNKLGNASSSYRYEPTNCANDKCTSYTLRSSLENEKDFVKSNKN